MRKVLIANIGNRSLVAKNDNGELSDFGQHQFKVIEKKSFREDTKALLDRFQEGDHDILELMNLNILNVLLDKFDLIDQVYLFTSNQEGKDVGQKQQDTIYAGELLKAIIEKKYKGVKAFPIPLVGVSVVNLEELVPAFRSELKKIIFECHKDSSFILCDSGGTPQQKNALKIVAEYFLNDAKVDTYQVRENYDPKEGRAILGEGTAELVNGNELRKIVDAQNIGLLIDKGEYMAAAEIRGLSEKDLVYKCLMVLHFRKNQIHDDAKKILIGEKKKGLPLVKQVSQWIELNHPFKERFQNLYRYISSANNKINYESTDSPPINDSFYLKEALELANFYYLKEDWSKVIHTYSIFLENFLIELIERDGYEKPYSNNRYKNCELQEDNVKQFLEAEGKLTYGEVRYSVPANIAYLSCKDNLESKYKEIIKSYQDIYSWWTTKRKYKKKGIDELRNKYAHEGRGLKYESIEEYMDGFEEKRKLWHDSFDVPILHEESAYLKCNAEIKKTLKLEP